jgi:hypothetical protein
MKDIFGPILKLFGVAGTSVTNEVIQGTVQGTTVIAENVADVSQDITNNVVGQPKQLLGTPVQQQMQDGGSNHWQQDSLHNDLQYAPNNMNNDEVTPDDSLSSIQQSSTGKAGWCYIGEERGTRTCMRVGVNDTCMSGDVFPTQDVCINPNLRA